MRPVLHFANRFGNWLGNRLPRRVVVAGHSMVPTLRAGDRLLVVPTGRGRPGQLVAVRDPRQPDRIMVKRIEAVDAVTGHYRVAGDNPGASTDSRHFGPVPPRLVLGRVVYRYAPSSRAGRFPRGAR